MNDLSWRVSLYKDEKKPKVFFQTDVYCDADNLYFDLMSRIMSGMKDVILDCVSKKKNLCLSNYGSSDEVDYYFLEWGDEVNEAYNKCGEGFNLVVTLENMKNSNVWIVTFSEGMGS